MIMPAHRQSLGRLDDRAAAVLSLINVRRKFMVSSTSRHGPANRHLVYAFNTKIVSKF